MFVARVALAGPPGAGKSTASKSLASLATSRGIAFCVIKLADPLYRCQAEIYKIAGRPLEDFYTQDGELLNFLGVHLRKINGTVLLDSFDQRLEAELRAFDAQGNSRALVVCDDMRATEASFLRGHGFSIIHVEAPPSLCIERRRQRGDTTLGDAAHVTEQPLEILSPDHVISNDGALDTLVGKLAVILDRVFS
jgi:dephospho-CoA kinase